MTIRCLVLRFLTDLGAIKVGFGGCNTIQYSQISLAKKETFYLVKSGKRVQNIKHGLIVFISKLPTHFLPKNDVDVVTRKNVEIIK